MKTQHRQAALILLPAALAGLAAVGSPWLPEVDGDEARPPVVARIGSEEARTLYQSCRDSVPASGAPRVRGDNSTPTQRPQWQQQAQAEMERCLREGAAGVTTARPASSGGPAGS